MTRGRSGEFVDLWIAVDADLKDNRRLWVLRNALALAASGDSPGDSLWDRPGTFRGHAPGSDYPHIAQVAGHVTFLFGKVARFATDGDLSDITTEQIEDWAGWTGSPGIFAREFRKTWLTDGVIDGWRDLNGKLIMMRERERTKKRNQRGGLSPGHSPGLSGGQSGDGPGDAPGDIPGTGPGLSGGPNLNLNLNQYQPQGGKSTKFSTANSALRGQAMQHLNAIRNAASRNGNGRPFVDGAKVRALGDVVWAAYEDIGGAERILSVAPKDVQYLLRDFTNAYIARSVSHTTGVSHEQRADGSEAGTIQ